MKTFSEYDINIITFSAWIMASLILVLLLALGVCEADSWQKLTCPYELQHESLQRVWCRQNSTDCCIGLIFHRSEHLLDGGNLKVTQGSESFTVAVLKLSLGEGVYWCGVLSQNGTIIKLAEGFFHSCVHNSAPLTLDQLFVGHGFSCSLMPQATCAYMWSFTRWILLPLLPLVTIFTNVSFRKGRGRENTALTRALADPHFT